jgi:hypothetical protein
MFQIFKKVVKSDGRTQSSEIVWPVANSNRSQLTDLLAEYGGQAFGRGLYRIIESGSLSFWNDSVSAAFPGYTGRIGCFAVDWLGRVFAVDSSRLEDAYPGVILFEPGTAEVLEIPCNLNSFHENELVNYGENALAISFYEEWISKGGAMPSLTQCIGYKKPLFLGGVDKVENLEIANLDVYWTISAQLIQQLRGTSRT